MLHVHRAERADRLVAALGDVLAGPLDDPLTTELVSVHSRGIERWISQELSEVLGADDGSGDGVCANVEFPFPSRLVHRAVAAGSRVDPERDPWLPERLTWPLLEIVDGDPDPELLGPLTTHLGSGTDPTRLTRRFGAVRHIADLFDRYGVHRPAMVRAWGQGADVGPAGGGLPPRHRWQPRLWRAVRGRVDDRIPSFAERIGAAVRVLREDPGVVDLPPRLALFGLTALPASYLTVLGAVAAHREVHLLLLHPSPSLWRRVSAVADESGQQLWTRADDPTAGLPRNPLLGSWGRDARELQLVTPAPAGDARHRHHAPTGDAPPPRDATLLARIQGDVRADRLPGSDPLPSLAPTDMSLQVHACHGRLRQVEVIRDAILHLMAADEDLEPRDVIVMCPDIEAFAPLVTAVFGADEVGAAEGPDRDPVDGIRGGGAPALRVRLADRSIRRTNPVLEVVALLLELVDGRMTASDVLDLAGREPVRRRFRLDDDDLETLEAWVADLGIRWGLDGAHRRRRGLPPLEANTWREGLTRLQLGVAMADEDLRLVGGVAPFDDVEGRETALAGRLTELVERLRDAADSMSTPQPVDAWRDAIGAAADALTATTARTRWQRVQLHRVLGDLVDEATTGSGAPSPVDLTLGEVRGMLDDRLAGRPSRTSHRTGDLTVCTLVPMRSVPHRVVCLLGLDDEVFPRQTVPDSDDLLLEAPRVGDRDPRSEDRQLLLDALLAATDTLVITYTGRDPRSNEERPPAVPVDELLDVVDRTVTTGQAGAPREAVTVRHPLQSFDPRSFTPGRLRRDGAPWGFDTAALEAARAVAGEPEEAPPFLVGPLPPPDEDTVELGDLVAFLQHPVRAFVRQRLQLSLPSADEQLADAIPLSLTGLERWRIGETLLTAWLRGQDQDRALEVVRARGVLPPGDLGGDALEEVRGRVARIRRLCDRLEVAPGRSRAVDVEVELPDGRTLVGSVPGVVGWRERAVSYSKVGARHRLAAWVRLLALTAGDPERPWSAVTVGRHPWKTGRAQGVVLPPPGATPDARRTTARARLTRLLDLYDGGLRSPVPLYRDASLKCAESLRRYGDPTRYVDKVWETDPYRDWDLEDRDPYHLLVLGGQIPTEALFEETCRDSAEASWWPDGDARFVAYAWRLWEPILEAERTCEA